MSTKKKTKKTGMGKTTTAGRAKRKIRKTVASAKKTLTKKVASDLKKTIKKLSNIVDKATKTAKKQGRKKATRKTAKKR